MGIFEPPRGPTQPCRRRTHPLTAAPLDLRSVIREVRWLWCVAFMTLGFLPKRRARTSILSVCVRAVCKVRMREPPSSAEDPRFHR